MPREKQRWGDLLDEQLAAFTGEPLGGFLDFFGDLGVALPCGQISPLDVNLQIAQPRDHYHQVAVVKAVMVQRDGVELLKLKQREPHISKLPPKGRVAAVRQLVEIAGVQVGVEVLLSCLS